MKKFKGVFLIWCLQVCALPLGNSTGASPRPRTQIEIFAEQAQAVKAGQPLQIAEMLNAAKAERSFYATQIIQLGSFGGRDAYRSSRDQYDRDLELLRGRFDFARTKIEILSKLL